MADNKPAPPIYAAAQPARLSQAAPAVAEGWRGRLSDAIRNAGLQAEDYLSYYAGPHATNAIRGLSGAAQMLSPASDIVGAWQESGQAVNAARSGDAPGVVEHAGYGLLSGMGLSEVAAPVKAIFAGVAAKTADMAKLRIAEKLEAEGKRAEDVLGETGWFRGADNKWRFEIDDSASRQSDAGAMGSAGDRRGGGTVGEAFDHPELYAAYPELADIPLTSQRLGPYNGTYSRDDATGRPRMAISDIAQDPRSTALHELQHGVQDVEGFASGGNISQFSDTANPREAYRSLAGEVEARNVEKRKNLPQESRASRFNEPWETEDVPRDKQIKTIRPTNRDVLAQILSAKRGQ